MDIVPDAGAVFGGVIGPVDVDPLPFAQCCQQAKRNQVGFGSMVLAQAALRVGAGDIEIPQDNGGKPLRGLGGFRQIANSLFDHQFGMPVGIDRALRAVLTDGDMFGIRFAVSGAGAREHQTGNPGLSHGRQQCQAASHIVFVIHQRPFTAFAHIGVGRKMHHCLYVVLLERVCQLVDIPNVGFDKGEGGKLVQNSGGPTISPAIIIFRLRSVGRKWL